MRTSIATNVVVLALVVLTLRTQALATTYHYFLNRRDVSMNGRWYVLTELVGGPEFDYRYGPVNISIICVPDDGAPKSKLVSGLSFPTEMTYSISNDWQVMSSRTGDLLISTRRLHQPPGKICVSGNGLGIALIDRYGPNKYLLENEDPCITILSSRGETIHEFTLSQIFDIDLVMFDNEYAGNIFWFHDGWIDEMTGSLVILGVRSSVPELELIPRTINLIDGSIGSDIEFAVIRGIQNPNSLGFQAAVEYSVIHPVEFTTKALADVLRRLPPQSLSEKFVRWALMEIQGTADSDIRNVLINTCERDEEAIGWTTHVPEHLDPSRVASFVKRVSKLSLSD